MIYAVADVGQNGRSAGVGADPVARDQIGRGFGTVDIKAVAGIA